MKTVIDIPIPDYLDYNRMYLLFKDDINKFVDELITYQETEYGKDEKKLRDIHAHQEIRTKYDHNEYMLHFVLKKYNS